MRRPAIPRRAMTGGGASWLIVCALAALWALSGCSDRSSGAQRQLQTTRCITDVSADAHRFECDGVVFNVMLTPECVARACGLILDVHGFLSNPEQQEQRSNLARAARDRGGYIVVQPGELSEPPSWRPEVHNALVFGFLQQAIEAFAVDEDRVHVTGFSQGGLMTWQLLCEHSPLIASAAPISAIEVGCFRSAGGPARRVPLLFISGTRDVLIQYYNPLAALSVPFTLMQVMYDYGLVSVDADAYAFGENGGLVTDASGRVDVAADGVRFEVLDGSDAAGYLWTRYTAEDGTVFEHLRHDNGHVYPDNPDSELFPEEPTVWFSVGDALLEFFVNNPRR
ncbi:MAG: hypothetical protein R3E54_11350 [Halioglobus sp.]